MANLNDFLVALCQRMGWEPTTWRLNVLKKMAEMEGNIDHLAEMWNPLSTTMPAGGAKDWNSVGVKIYPDMATGVEATAQTIEAEDYYPGLRATMQAQSPQPGIEQSLKTWGWQDAGQLSPAGQQILSVMGGTTGQGEAVMAKPTQSADVTAATAQPAGGGSMANEQDFIAWLKAHGFGSYVQKNPDGTEVAADANWNPVPSWLGQAYVEDTMGTTSGLAPEEAAYKTAQTAEINLGIADYPRLVSLDEREQKRKEIETEISAGTLEWNKGVDKFNAWLNATGEARLRAEKEMGQKEWQLPTKYFPGTEPGGMLATVAKRYGLPFTPLEGTPVTQQNSAEGIYNKWQKNMGAPLQAPAFPGGQGGGYIGAMGGAATQLAGMAGGGYLPTGQSAITSEYGPEVITATSRGTTVRPLGGTTPYASRDPYVVGSVTPTTPAIYPGGDPYVVTPRPVMPNVTPNAPPQFSLGAGGRNVLGYGPNAALQAPREDFSFATARQAGEPGSLDPNWTGRDLNIPSDRQMEVTTYPWEAPKAYMGGQLMKAPATSAAHQHVNEILRRARWRGYQPYTPRKTEV